MPNFNQEIYMIYSMPSYLKELVTEVDNDILSKIQNDYGEYTTAFKFNTKFKGLIRTWINEYGEYGSTVWGIDAKDEKIIIFDPLETGYDGLMGLNEEEDLNSTKTINFTNEAEIIIAFQYSGSEEEYLEDGNSKFKEDYFDWLVIYKYDSGTLEELIDIECA
jgi:hypothetical protein